MTIPDEYGFYLRFCVRDVETDTEYYEEISDAAVLSSELDEEMLQPQYFDVGSYIYIFHLSFNYAAKFDKKTKEFEIKQLSLPQLEDGLLPRFKMHYSYKGKLYFISEHGVLNYTDNEYMVFSISEGDFSFEMSEYYEYSSEVVFDDGTCNVELVGVVKDRVILLLFSKYPPSAVPFPEGYDSSIFWIEINLKNGSYQYKFYEKPIVRQLSIGVEYARNGQYENVVNYPDSLG